MNKLYMMVGLPASGKSTIAEEISKSEGAIIVSSDEIRKELLGDINDQNNNELVFKTVEKRIKEGLLNGNAIYDATNINYKRRRTFLHSLGKMKVKKIAVLVATPYEECLERNAKRERKVPEEVIKRMYHSFYIPQYYEGFDEIEVKYNCNVEERTFFTGELQDIPQDNPHHTLSVLEHCRAVRNILADQDANMELRIAGLLHDIGKLKTKSFINSRGEITDVAHFYNHENVSAYDSLFHTSMMFRTCAGKRLKDSSLYILNLIQWHMILHFDWKEKTINKYKKMLGTEIWKDLEILHEADCEAR